MINDMEKFSLCKKCLEFQDKENKYKQIIEKLGGKVEDLEL